MRGAQETRFIGLARLHLAGNATREEHDGPIAGEADLGELGGEQKDRGALRRDLAQERIDLPLRADVDAARRIEAQERAKPRREPARDDDLLLVATTEASHFRGSAPVDLQTLDGAFDALSLRAHRDRAPGAEPAE